jgi:hypothetical protein
MRLILAVVSFLVGPEAQAAEIVAQAIGELFEEGHPGALWLVCERG